MRALAASALPAQCHHTPVRTRAPAQRVSRTRLQAQRRAPLCRISSAPTGPSSDSADDQPTGVVSLERRINEAVVSSTVRASALAVRAHFLVDSPPLSPRPTPPQVLLFDTLYTERPYARFYVLETIARVPYFCASPPLWSA
jgi:hypothetical protein